MVQTLAFWRFLEHGRASFQVQPVPGQAACACQPAAYQKHDEERYDAGMEPRVLHVSEADAVRGAAPVRRTISECIALAKAHEEEPGQAPTLDRDFAADVEQIIRHRKPRNPLA